MADKRFREEDAASGFIKREANAGPDEREAIRILPEVSPPAPKESSAIASAKLRALLAATVIPYSGAQQQPWGRTDRESSSREAELREVYWMPPFDVSNAPRRGSRKKGRRPGPSPDNETAARVAQILTPAGPQWSSGDTLDNVLMDLDDGEIPIPKTWKKKHNIHTWTDAGGNSKTRHLARLAIKHHLQLAARAGKL
jgi:hypothetical protein